jgi:hypothetical protein
MMPMIRLIFAMFDPITFPRTMPPWCLKEATIEVPTSGMDVPSATKVKPITNSDTPNCFAVFTAVATNISDPFTSRIRPMPNRTISVRSIEALRSI